MAHTLMDLAKNFAAQAPPVRPFSTVAPRSQKSRVDAAMAILKAIAGSEKEVSELCKHITGPTAKDVALCAGKLLGKNPSAGTSDNTFAKATILQILAPFMNRRQLEECGVKAGQKAYLSAVSRHGSCEILQRVASAGRKSHSSPELTAAEKFFLPHTRKKEPLSGWKKSPERATHGG